MPHVDARGLGLAGTTPAALEAFEVSLMRFVAGDADALATIDRALVVAPAFAMGHALRAAASIVADEPAGPGDLARAIRAIQLGDAVDERAHRHAQAARAWLDGDQAVAHARYAGIVEAFPRDLIALRVAHALDFRFGLRAELRDRIERVLPHWTPDLPGFGHVLAMHAFGLEENGAYDAAEAAAHRALALEPASAAAIHTLAHICEMRGRAADGIALVERTRGVWAGNAGLASHIQWHLAVFHVDQGDVERALALYDTALAPRNAGVGTLVDAAALLWRLELRGRAVGGRWRTLAHAWSKHPLQGARAFNIVHAVVAQAGARRFRHAHRTADLLRDDAARRVDRHEDVELAQALSAAIIAFARGDYADAAERISDVRTRADQCGGSVAQCDFIHLTLIEAALRAQRDRLARALVAERAARRPLSLLSRWLCARAATPLAA